MPFPAREFNKESSLICFIKTLAFARMSLSVPGFTVPVAMVVRFVIRLLIDNLIVLIIGSSRNIAAVGVGIRDMMLVEFE